MSNFWSLLPKPFTVLAPMDAVTDAVFRRIVLEVSRPNVFFTEFTNVDGLLSMGRKKVEERLLFDPAEQPIIAQIWGTDPENFKKAARLVSTMGFSGIDINMGCPERTIVKQGACSALINNPQLAKAIIDSTREGAGDIPVSVKTRIGFSSPAIDDWISFLLTQKLPALTVHLRTASELSMVPAHWEYMEQIVRLRNTISPETIIIGNGGIKSLDEVREKFDTYNNEGFMVGTGIFSNPWLFDPKRDPGLSTRQERIELYSKHIKLFRKVWKDKKNPAIIKKFCKMYISGFPGASEFRDSLMKTNTLEELLSVLLLHS